MSFSLFSPCIEDYNKKYVSQITTYINNIDAKTNEIINKVKSIGKSTRYALGKPEDVGTYYIAVDVAHETNNFFIAALYTPLTSLSGQTFGTSKSCMDKFCTFAYAHYMLDKTPQNAYNVPLDSTQQQDFNEIIQFFKNCRYIKIIDIFQFPGVLGQMRGRSTTVAAAETLAKGAVLVTGAMGRGGGIDAGVDQILLQTFTIQSGSFNEEFTPMATFFNTLMPSYIQSLKNTYQMLTAYVESLLVMPDDALKEVIPDIDESSVALAANKGVIPPSMSQQAATRSLAAAAAVAGVTQSQKQVAPAAALTSPTVEALVDEQVVATAAAATVALNDTNKKDEDDEKVVAAAAAAAINLE